MIEYYKVPVKKGVISQEQRLHCSDDADLKDAIYNKSIEKAKIVSFKNANIKDDTLRLLVSITNPLPIVQLDLSQNFSFITDKAVEILVEVSSFKHLKILNLADNQISDQSLVLLSKAACMHHLEELILYGNADVTGAGLLFLSQSPFLKHLKYLDLHATSVDDEGVQEFMRSQNSQNLQRLNLSMSWQRITNKTLYSIAHSQFCKKLKQLLLEDCKVGDQGIDELSQSQNAVSLQELSLNNSIKHKNNIITDKTLTSIGLSKYLVNLSSLELRNTDITAKGIKTLAVSLAAEKIEQLRLSHCNQIDEQVITYLQKIANYQSLKKVYLNECKIDPQELHLFQHKNPQLHLIY